MSDKENEAPSADAEMVDEQAMRLRFNVLAKDANQLQSKHRMSAPNLLRRFKINLRLIS